MTACRATLNLEGLLRGTASPTAATPGGAHPVEPVDPACWRIIAADGSSDPCPCPAPANSSRVASAREGKNPRGESRVEAAEFARLVAGLEVMAAVGLSLPAESKPKLAMPSGTPDMTEILAAASAIAAPPPQEPLVEAAQEAASSSCHGCGPSGACQCQRPELQVVQVVDAWSTLPHSIQSAILAVVEAVRMKDEG